MDRRQLAPGYKPFREYTGCLKLGAMLLAGGVAVANLDVFLSQENPEPPQEDPIVAERVIPTAINDDPNDMIWDHTNYVNLGASQVSRIILPDQFPGHHPELKNLPLSELIEFYAQDESLRKDFMELDGQKSLGGRHIWLQEQDIREDYLEDLFQNGVVRRIMIPRNNYMVLVIVDRGKFDSLDSESLRYFPRFLRDYLYVYWPHIRGMGLEAHDPVVCLNDVDGNWFAWVTDSRLDRSNGPVGDDIAAWLGQFEWSDEAAKDARRRVEDREVKPPASAWGRRVSP